MTRVKLSDATAAALPAPPAGGRPVYHSDTAERNLSLKISPAGARSWWFVGRIGGRPERIGLGPFPEFAYDEAVARCVRVRAAVYDGRDPREVLAYARPQRGAGLTLGGLWAMYGDQRGQHARALWDLDCSYFNRYCGRLAGRRLEALTPDILAAWHQSVGDEYGRPTANKMLNTLRAVFNWALGRRGPDGRPLMTTNPAASKAVPRFNEFDRDRYLDADELRLIFQAVSDHPSQDCRHWFQLSLFTAQRRASVLSMSFDQIDAANWIWNIPRELMKGRRSGHAVPLVAQAQGILETRRQATSGEWVFPARRRATTPHIVNPTRWWHELTEAAGITDATIHDIRRTTASWMAITGSSEAIIANLLGHKRQGVTARYARLDITAVREAAQRAVDTMLDRAGIAHVRGSDGCDVPYGTIVPLGLRAGGQK